jgi:hypothetical protein
MTEPLPAASRLLRSYCRSVETARSHRRGPIEKYLLRAIHVRVWRCDEFATPMIMRSPVATQQLRDQARLPDGKTKHTRRIVE